jgi:hypothetical protein
MPADDTDLDLIAARQIWAHGEPLPVDLYVRLTNEGYDVDAMEQEYLK